MSTSTNITSNSLKKSARRRSASQRRLKRSRTRKPSVSFLRKRSQKRKRKPIDNLPTKNSPLGELFVRVARYLKIGGISSPASPFVHLTQGALGTSVNQWSLLTATFAPLGNPPHNGGGRTYFTTPVPGRSRKIPTLATPRLL